MLIVKDAMVLIHLAKANLLEKSCDYFKNIIIPPLVREEATRSDYPDARLIQDLIGQAKIRVETIKDKTLLFKAHQFNLQRGEAEAVALYWEKKAELLATDDDNVRKKKMLLQLAIIGTPSILLQLYKKKKIDQRQLKEAIKVLKETAWFSNMVWDKIIMEAER